MNRETAVPIVSTECRNSVSAPQNKLLTTGPNKAKVQPLQSCAVFPPTLLCFLFAALFVPKCQNRQKRKQSVPRTKSI